MKLSTQRVSKVRFIGFVGRIREQTVVKKMASDIDQLIVGIEEKCQLAATVCGAFGRNIGMRKCFQAFKRDMLIFGSNSNFPGVSSWRSKPAKVRASFCVSPRLLRV